MEDDNSAENIDLSSITVT